jgi:hypothetical protein
MKKKNRGAQGIQLCFWGAIAATLSACGGGGSASTAETSAQTPAPVAAPAPAPTPSAYNVAVRYASLPAPGASMPAAPVTTSSVQVANSAALNAALSTAARRITCVPGSVFTQPVAIHQSDTLLDMTGCAIDDGVGGRALTVNADRVRVNGGTWNGGFGIGQRSDVHVHAASFTGTNPAGSLNEVMSSTRVLIEHSSLVQRSNNVGLWAQQATDLVIANSRVENTGGGQSTIRTHGSKVVVMDSYVQNSTHHTLRAHADGPVASPYVVYARNIIQGGRIQAWGGSGDPLQVQNMWITDNEFHFNATGLHISAPSITHAVITGNRTYDGLGDFQWSSFASWSVSNNTSFPYQAAGSWNYQ